MLGENVELLELSYLIQNTTSSLLTVATNSQMFKK